MLTFKFAIAIIVATTSIRTLALFFLIEAIGKRERKLSLPPLKFTIARKRLGAGK